MKKIYLIVALAASFLVTPVWAKPVDYRVAFGVFESVHELVKVTGIGATLIEKNWDSITVDTDSDSDC